MAQADDIKALQEQVKALTERLETLESAPPPAAEPIAADDSRLAAIEDRIEKIRAFVNAPA